MAEAAGGATMIEQGELSVGCKAVIEDHEAFAKFNSVVFTKTISGDLTVTEELIVPSLS